MPIQFRIRKIEYELLKILRDKQTLLYLNDNINRHQSQIPLQNINDLRFGMKKQEPEN